jgi:hypothetical protein
MIACSGSLPYQNPFSDVNYANWWKEKNYLSMMISVILSVLKLEIQSIRMPAITIRLVLSHQSSINDSQGYFTLDAINPSKNPDWAKCLMIMRGCRIHVLQPEL